MSLRFKLKEHFSVGQLQENYRQCGDAVEKTHWWIIWKLQSQQEPVAALASQSGYCRQWIYKLIARYNRLGSEGLKDLRVYNKSLPLLDQAGQKALAKALQKQPQDGGLWTGPKVELWMSQYLQKPVAAGNGLRYLHRLGWSLQVPRPKHQQSASPQQQRAYKKTPQADGSVGTKTSRKKG
jgi:transposase